MKRLVAAVLGLFLTFSPIVAQAEDEQWPKPNETALGHHAILVEESTQFRELFPSLFTFQGPVPGQLACASLADINCKDAGSIEFYSNFAPCSGSTDFDCVEDLRIQSGTKSAVAQFVRYIHSNHPNPFEADGQLLAKHNGSPTLWRIPDAPHSAGDLYLLIAGHSGFIQSGRITSSKLFSQLVPVSELEGMWNGVIDQNGIGVIGQCVERTLESGHTAVVGCGAGAFGFGEYRCAAWEQDGTCLLKKAHRMGDEVSLTLRLKNEPTGWLHGRIENPIVETSSSNGFSVLKVSAKPVRVPILYHGGLYSNLPTELQKYWDDCMKIPDCPAWTRIANSNPKGQADGNLRNVQGYEEPYGDRVLAAVSKFAKYVNDTPVAAPTTWAFRTLDLNQNPSVTNCVARFRGTLGVVTTNALAYSEGPPKLVDGSLRYSVAGLHYQTDGKTLSLGTYDLLMRSDFARCIYGFSNAPLQASISVLTVGGENVVATTQVSERNGWLKLAAYGFTFSEKEVRVTLTQAKQPVKVSANLPRFAGKSTRLTGNQRFAVETLMADVDQEANTSASCTAYFVKASDKNLASARARAACAYAKTLAPSFTFTSEAKQTKSRGLDGRVTIVSQ